MPRQVSELRNAQTSGNCGEHKEVKAPKLKVKSVPGKPLNIDMEPNDAVRLLSAFGTAEAGFAHLMLSCIINAACDRGAAGVPEAGAINEALAAVAGIGALDEIEGMLATQMVATHLAAITALRRLKGAENIPQQDSNGNLAVKLLRTFTAQLETLQRYRGKGQQKVTVEHVNVNAGGQAIVGVVHSTERNGKKPEEQADAARAIAYAPDTALRCSDPERQAVPIAGGARKTPL
jgi:hypothetical protein